MDEGRWQDAERAWRAILARRREHPQALRGLAEVALETGRPAMAAELLAYGADLEPDDAETRYRLAQALRRCGRADEAELAIDTALALGPARAAWHNERGLLLAGQGRLAEAEASFRQALACDADFADAHFHLAGLKRFSADDPDLRALEALDARRKTLDGPQRMALDFALGKARDDIGDFARAFEALQRANAMVRAQRPCDHAAMTARLARCRELFTAARVEALREAGHDSPVPVFIVGLPRSGSTLLEHRLAAHSRVASAGEGPWLSQSLQAVCADSGGDPLAAFERLDGEGLRRLGEDYVARLAAVAGPAERVLDKTLLNFLHLGLPALALPRAVFLHVRRDPLDTGLSIYQQYFTEGLNFAFDLRDIGRFTRLYREHMALWRALFPGRIVDVDYEALVADTAGVMGRVVEAVGLAWEEACIGGESSGRFNTASKAQVARPVYRSSVGRWRNYAQWLMPLREMLEDDAE